MTTDDRSDHRLVWPPGKRGTRHAMRASGFTDPAFARLADLAHLLAGLVFPPNRQPSAEAGMRRAMTALRISDPGALLHAVETPGEARDVVLAELTVGESYFFRDEAQLHLLATEILPLLMDHCGADRPLRVWSAGCASGEEPHTIAIMLRELGWPHPARILGTDVAIPRLDAARRGRYTRWALRGVSGDRVAKWFRRGGNHFELDRSVRESVEFRELNLVHDGFPPDHSGAGAGGYDLVLCRNVMIYFDLPTVARIAERLLDSLAPDGWLVLGASDPPLAHLVPCEWVMTTGGIAYRRAGRLGAAQPSIVHDVTETLRAETYAAPVPSDALPEPLVVARIGTPRDAPAPAAAAWRDTVADDAMVRAYERADYPATEAMAIIALTTSADGQDTLAPWILYIRAIANQGRLNDAGEHCARALETHPLAAELHYLHAMLLAEAGWHADAVIAARRSIYLDRQLVMGHLLLGDALARTGDSSGARIAFENVLALLADADPSVPIAAADRVPAPRLRQVATLRLRELTAGGRR